MSEDGSRTWRRNGWRAMLPTDGVDPRALAETIPGPSTEAFAALARETQTILSVPVLEYVPISDQFFNAFVLIGPDGKTLAHYRKLNPWPLVESGWAAKGDRSLAVAETPVGRLGVLICYDIHFIRELELCPRIDTLLFSSAWFDLAGSDFFGTELPGIAKEFGINIVAANWGVSKKQRWHGYGESCVIDRSGDVLARAQRTFGDQVVRAELNCSRRDAKAQR